MKRLRRDTARAYLAILLIILAVSTTGNAHGVQGHPWGFSFTASGDKLSIGMSRQEAAAILERNGMDALYLRDKYDNLDVKYHNPESVLAISIRDGAIFALVLEPNLRGEKMTMDPTFLKITSMMTQDMFMQKFNYQGEWALSLFTRTARYYAYPDSDRLYEEPDANKKGQIQIDLEFIQQTFYPPDKPGEPFYEYLLYNVSISKSVRLYY